MIIRKLEVYETDLKQFEDDLKSVTGDTVPLIPQTDSDMLVFTGNTDKIGLLDPKLSLVVLKFYQRTRDLISDSELKWGGMEVEWIDKDENKVGPLWYGFFRTHVDRVSELIAYITPRMNLINAWASQAYWKKLSSDLRNMFRTENLDTDI